MDIRGLYKFTLVDFPGKIAAIIFTAGCNLRCSFCHNPCLVLDPGSQPPVLEREVLKYLEHRKGLLEGLVITGGEPLLQADLGDFIRKVHDLGFAVKLDTNGTMPDRLEALLAAMPVEAIGLDCKAPLNEYSHTVNVDDPELGKKVARAIGIAQKHPEIDLDVRTTVHRALLPPEALRKMAEELAGLGVKRWTLQQFNPVEIMDDDLAGRPTYSDGELGKLAAELAPVLGGKIRVRGLTGRILES